MTGATAFSHTTGLAHNANVNDTRLSDFLASVREFGRDAASGKDALPKLAISVVSAAADGVIDQAKDQDGKDGATRIFEEYTRAEGKKAIHNRSPESVKAQVSKLRQLINFGSNPKFDGVEVINEAFEVRTRFMDEGIEVKPAYAAYVDVAREQLKQDTQLTTNQIESVVAKSTAPKETSLEKVYQKMQKDLESIITGEGKGSLAGLKDDAPEIEQMHELIGQRLAKIMQAKLDAEDDAKLAEATEILSRRGAESIAA